MGGRGIRYTKYLVYFSTLLRNFAVIKQTNELVAGKRHRLQSRLVCKQANEKDSVERKK